VKCNNPLTKIPKLENALQVIGQEWKDLDEEARAVEQIMDTLELSGFSRTSNERSTLLEQLHAGRIDIL
jgi:hypothetical protein